MAEPGPPAAANPPASARGDEVDEGLTGSLSKEVFSTYACRSLSHIVDLRPHPGDIAEPAALAAVPLPPTDYPVVFPPELISSGKLSALQLEGIVHAATKHLTWLPSGERAGFFIGDMAGVGKGRQIAGLILDSYLRGRRRSAWVTTSTDLHADEVRDMRDLECHIAVHKNLQSLDKATNTPTDGVMFLTYSTLTSNVKGRPRLQQLVEWLGGPTFDGVLVFDEAHKAKNFSENEKQGTKMAASVIELQRCLPAARVVYCSATGVSEVGNMAYMPRLGLFGPGSAFPDFNAFLNSMKRRGMSFMELLAMELKGDGSYVARGLSFRSAEFLEVEAALTGEQIEVYDAATAAWAELRGALAEAIASGAISASNSSSGRENDPWRPFWSAQQRFFKLLCVSMKVPTIVAEAQAALQEGKCVVIGLQTTGEAAADALNLTPGDSCGFISVTKEIMLQFVKNHFPTQRQAAPAAAAYLAYTTTSNGGDGGGGWGLSLMGTTAPSQQPPQQGAPAEEHPGAVVLKSRVLETIEGLQLPPNFLDELIDKLGGKKAVAEMTGRKARVVRDTKGRGVYENRAKPESHEMESLNSKEKEDFMAGKKLVAIISDAASTGISLHADKRVANQRRRVHLTIELPWSADKAIQQLGRSHRSNQTSAPIYKLVFTDLGGEKRFAAAVARRLQSLGALTRGDRRAASGLDLGAMNLDSPLGRRALRRMYDAFIETSPMLPQGVKLEDVLEGLPQEEVAELAPCFAGEGARPSAADLVDTVKLLHETLRGYVDLMGISIGNGPKRDATVVKEPAASAAVAAAVAAAGASSKDTGDVRRFLNRLLAVPVRRQHLLFNYFSLSLESEIRAAKAAGNYNEGVSDLPGQQIHRESPPKVVWTDDLTGLSTLCHTLAVDRGVSFPAAASRFEHEARQGDRSGFYRSRRPAPGTGVHSVLLALQKPGGGGVFSVIRPNTGPSFFEMDLDELRGKYSKLASPEAVQAEWETAYEESLQRCTHGWACQSGPDCRVGKRLTQVTLLSGSVVRIWDTLEKVLTLHEAELSKVDRTMRTVRVELSDDAADEAMEVDEGGGDAREENCGAGASTPAKAAAAATVPAAQVPLIGVRYPGHLLAEVVATLTAQRAAQGGGQAARPRRTEDPAPVDPKSMKKAFSAPKTVLDFFKPKAPKTAAASTAASEPPSKSSSAPKRTAISAAPAPKGKRLNGGGQTSLFAAVKIEEKKKASPNGVSLEAVASLTALGFDKSAAERALRYTDGSVERAANMLLGQ